MLLVSLVSLDYSELSFWRRFCFSVLDVPLVVLAGRSSCSPDFLSTSMTKSSCHMRPFSLFRLPFSTSIAFLHPTPMRGATLVSVPAPAGALLLGHDSHGHRDRAITAGDSQCEPRRLAPRGRLLSVTLK